MARRKRRQDGHFAMLPVEVLESAAWRTLRHSARSTLTVLAAQYRGTHNGIQTLTPTVCERYGIVHDTALRDARELERRGLIVKTYQARFRPAPQRLYASSWALGWRPITHRENTMLDAPIPPPNEWAKWQPDENPTPTRDRYTADERSA